MEQTPNGIKYNWYLTGPQGARYELHPEKHHTKEDINIAKSYLNIEHDAVKIYIIR